MIRPPGRRTGHARPDRNAVAPASHPELPGQASRSAASLGCVLLHRSWPALPADTATGIPQRVPRARHRQLPVGQRRPGAGASGRGIASCLLRVTPGRQRPVVDSGRSALAGPYGITVVVQVPAHAARLEAPRRARARPCPPRRAPRPGLCTRPAGARGGSSRVETCTRCDCAPATPFRHGVRRTAAARSGAPGRGTT